MKVALLIVAALEATAAALPQLNLANQQTSAMGGIGSAIVASGSANAGNSISTLPGETL